MIIQQRKSNSIFSKTRYTNDIKNNNREEYKEQNNHLKKEPYKVQMIGVNTENKQLHISCSDWP
jgi:hypothetical protein